jgi:hypothetical protein
MSDKARCRSRYTTHLLGASKKARLANHSKAILMIHPAPNLVLNCEPDIKEPKQKKSGSKFSRYSEDSGSIPQNIRYTNFSLLPSTSAWLAQ